MTSSRSSREFREPRDVKKGFIGPVLPRDSSRGTTKASNERSVVTKPVSVNLYFPVVSCFNLMFVFLNICSKRNVIGFLLIGVKTFVRLKMI